MTYDERAARLGELIRRQRELSELSMRQFASLAGISNPYLSQIERGLREPSEKVLDAIAGALDSTADALYEQAGVGDDAGRQRQALLEVYASFTAGAPARRRR